MNPGPSAAVPRSGWPRSTALVLAMLASGTAWGDTPPPPSQEELQTPFEARSTRRLELFRVGRLKKADMTEVAAGTLVTVLSREGESTWESRPEQLVKVALDGRSTYYALRSRLEPLGTAERLSADDAGALLFARVPEARRSWCVQFTRRIQPSTTSPRTLVYSASADSDCAGYLAWVSGTGKAARVLAHTRRGALQAVTVHAFASAPAVVELMESLPGNARLHGIRRLFLGLGTPALKELLAVDVRRDEQEKTHRRSSLAEIDVHPSQHGLDIEVRRTRSRVDSTTGAESDVVRDTQRYQYADGKLSARAPSREK